MTKTDLAELERPEIEQALEEPRRASLSRATGVPLDRRPGCHRLRADDRPNIAKNLVAAGVAERLEIEVELRHRRSPPHQRRRRDLWHWQISTPRFVDLINANF